MKSIEANLNWKWTLSRRLWIRWNRLNNIRPNWKGHWERKIRIIGG